MSYMVPTVAHHSGPDCGLPFRRYRGRVGTVLHVIEGQTSLWKASPGLVALGLAAPGLVSLGLASLGLVLVSCRLASLGLASFGLAPLGLVSLGLVC